MDKFKAMVRKVLIVLLILWMIGVFLLSNQNGQDSGNLSKWVANIFSGGDTVKAEIMEPIVRKVAHVTEYAVGGMIFYGITLTYSISKRKQVVCSIVFIVLYASLDEAHQLFIDKRNGSYLDVIIDSAGGVLGIGAITIIERAITAIDEKVKEDLKNPKL